MAAKILCQSSKSLICESQIDSPIGLVSIHTCKNGLHRISHQDHVSDENFVPNHKATLSIARQNIDDSSNTDKPNEMDNSLNWLHCYFTSKKDSKNVEKHEAELRAPKFCFPSEESTEFERLVWLTLFEKTKNGDTISYKTLAELIERPNAARAVGTALKKNPIPIVIPCHRVIKSNGVLGNYSGGTKNKIKEFLIQHEKNMEL